MFKLVLKLNVILFLCVGSELFAGPVVGLIIDGKSAEAAFKAAEADLTSAKAKSLNFSFNRSRERSEEKKSQLTEMEMEFLKEFQERFPSIKKIKEFIAKGVDINVRGGEHVQTPALHDVVETFNFELVKLLLESGADVNAKDSLDNTALDLLKNKTDVLELDHGAGLYVSEQEFLNGQPFQTIETLVYKNKRNKIIKIKDILLKYGGLHGDKPSNPLCYKTFI